MSEHTLYVGLDTDKSYIDVGIAEPLPTGEVRYWGKSANEPASVDRLIKRLQREGRHLEVCYEAGPCGYGLYRQLNGKPGVSCRVIAPSMTPRRPGVRVKTNRRDSLTLAKLLRADELTSVWVPDEAHEALRDLVRARHAAVTEMIRCRQRISSFLLRQAIRYAAKAWTKKHRVWLGRLAFAQPAHRLLFDEMLCAIDQATARRDRLSDHIAECVPNWSLFWLVEAVQAMHGYRLINAVSLVAEIGDPRRFDNPRQLMSFVGMVPSERSTGDKIRRGALTKTGNGRVRRTLIEAAWTYTRRLKTPASAPTSALAAIADKARHRLSARYRKLIARGKSKPLAAAAIAREQIGFVWAIAHAAGPAVSPPSMGSSKQTAVGPSGLSKHGSVSAIAVKPRADARQTVKGLTARRSRAATPPCRHTLPHGEERVKRASRTTRNAVASQLPVGMIAAHLHFASTGRCESFASRASMSGVAA